jgi:hypothetical protein
MRSAFWLVIASSCLYGQDAQPQQPAVSVAERWHFFVQETLNPMTLAGGAFNAGVSQAGNSDPRYGVGSGAYAERFAASVTDIVSQNFCVDFLMATVWHEDTRYVRKGSGHSVWSRTGWAISRAFVTRTDDGRPTVNWANLTGTALAGGISCIYYPPASRTGSGVVLRYGIGIGGGALTNLLPEFGPEVWRWIKRHHI